MSLHLSLTGKHWHLPSQQAHVPPSGLVALLAKQREIDIRSAPTFVDPCVFPDMRRAVDRILHAIEKQERIAIFGDYDCDGVTSTAQLVRFFERRGVTPIVRLPHRVQDGYGLNPAIVQEFIDQQIALLITVDTGIGAIDEIAALKEANIDTIVTDHHQHREELPAAHAIIHPALAPGYPQPHPAGAGVVYQLLRALEGGNVWETSEVDTVLAMIGTIADVVDLRGNNRSLVQTGLRSIPDVHHHPLGMLIEKSGCTVAASSTDIAFRIAPRINAAGRMAHPLLALDAVLKGGEVIEQLDQLNRERQIETVNMVEQARGDFDSSSPLIASASEEYAHGIVGLIAGRLTEEMGKPSVIATIEGDQCTASLRSPPCYNIAQGLQRCQQYLTRFGGHAQAAGCTLPVSEWDAFIQALTADVAEHVAIDQLHPSLCIAAELTPADINISLIRELHHLAPFGQGNPEPLFLLRRALISDTRTVGKDYAHLQGRVGGIKMVGFNLGHLMPQLHEPVDIVYRLEIDTWQGREQVQMVVVDVGMPVEAIQKMVN